MRGYVLVGFPQKKNPKQRFKHKYVIGGAGWVVNRENTDERGGNEKGRRRTR